MLTIVGVCGSRIKDGNMEAFLAKALSHAGAQDGVRAELIPLHDKRIEGCTQCNWCVRKQSDGKFCVEEDGMSEIYPKLLDADGIILASPAHFGRLSGHLANMIDRLRVFVHGNVYKGALKNKVGGAMAVAYFRGGGVETTLQSINLLFLTVQMIVASPSMSQQGAAAFTTRDGKGRFEKENRHIVLEDDYGVASAARLADRIIELARLVKAGQKALHFG
jgi:multimeric flavodoxin WrbA